MKLFHKVKPEMIEMWHKAEHPMLLHYTGSMFGIGCDARDTIAVQNLNQLKNRDSENSYIVLIDSVETLEAFHVQISSRFKGLIGQYSPGNITIVLPCDHPQFAHLKREGKVAFRIPEDADLRNFLRKAQLPLISTSINLRGEEPEIDFRNIITEYNSWFDLALVPEDELIAEGIPSTILTLESEKLVCLRKGSVPFEHLEKDYYQPLVNFVCTGNICRSPLAEYYFRQQAEARGLSWRVTSSGLLESGISISENSLILLENDGIDGSAHRSKQVSKEMIKRSRLVLTMTSKHKVALQNAGWDTGNIFTLGEYVGHVQDIKDPYQQSIEVYENAYTQIKFYVDLLIDKLRES